MSRIARFAVALATVGMAAAASQAADVAMFGSYGEANGIIVNIPQNPPIVPCIPPPLNRAYGTHATVGGVKANNQPTFIELRPTGPNDARCPARNSVFAGTGRARPSVFNRPQRGVQAQGDATVMGKKQQWLNKMNGGLNVGDAFTIPPFAFQQQLGKQIGIVLNSPTRQLDTTFIAAMPATNRISGMQPNSIPNGPYTLRPPAAQAAIPALTRMFSQMNWQNPGNGQNNGANPTTMLPTPFAQRLAANTEHLNTGIANEKIRVRYFAGPREFGGTMTLLLDGSGILWLGGPLLDGAFPAALQHAAGKQPVGDQVPGFRVRNADGWDIQHVGFQARGTIKAFFSGFNPANGITPMGAQRFAPNCVTANPPTPIGCNEVNGFTTFMVGTPTAMIFAAALKGPGGTVRTLPTASSVKHAFALTTGTVSMVRVANRANQGGVQTLTMTGMGYDTVGVTAMGAPQRNVGLVAGSYSVRTEFLPTGPNLAINPQLLGVDLHFTPEPASSAALASALGLIGLLAYRRRSA